VTADVRLCLGAAATVQRSLTILWLVRRVAPHRPEPRLPAGDREPHLHFHGVNAEVGFAIPARVNHDGPERVDPETP